MSVFTSATASAHTLSLDNVTALHVAPPETYILLLKRHPSKDYCTLYLSDCCHNVWLERLDEPFLKALRDATKMGATVADFAQALARAISESGFEVVMPNPSSAAEKEESVRPTIAASLKVSEGVRVRCSLTPSVHLNSRTDP